MKFDPFFMIFDLEWTRMISTPGFLKSWCQELNFEVSFAYFKKYWNLTLFSWFLTLSDLEWPLNQLFWKADAKSFILIYNLHSLRQFWNLTKMAIFGFLNGRWRPNCQKILPIFFLNIDYNHILHLLVEFESNRST